MEVVISFAIDTLGWERKRATLILGSLVFLTGIPSALSYGILGNLVIANYRVFDFLGMLTDNILLPCGGIAMCYFSSACRALNCKRIVNIVIWK